MCILYTCLEAPCTFSSPAPNDCFEALLANKKTIVPAALHSGATLQQQVTLHTYNGGKKTRSLIQGQLLLTPPRADI